MIPAILLLPAVMLPLGWGVHQHRRAAALTEPPMTATPVCHPYTWGEVCRMNRADMAALVDEGDGKSTNDKGERVPADTVGGYHRADTVVDGVLQHRIGIIDSCAGAWALLHELAHADGVADPSAAGYDP